MSSNPSETSLTILAGAEQKMGVVDNGIPLEDGIPLSDTQQNFQNVDIVPSSRTLPIALKLSRGRKIGISTILILCNSVLVSP